MKESTNSNSNQNASSNPQRKQSPKKANVQESPNLPKEADNDKEADNETKKEQIIPIGPQNLSQKTSKSKVLGAKLSEYELNLYEYSTFSLCEEIDIFFCKHNTKSDDVTYNEDTVRTKC